MQTTSFRSIPYVKLGAPLAPVQSTDSSAGSSWQTNLQGLRGMAIVGVMLFHLWPEWFSVGYLGVDIFFVISGYLMFFLLSSKTPMPGQQIPVFYFRRIKRIIPAYLFVILIGLVAAFWFISPTDFVDLRAETFNPLVYAANMPSGNQDDYFAETQGGFSFFVHLWSLSTELQFYAFVPFLVFVLHRIALSCQLILVLSISAVSFYAQYTSSGNYEHMALASRVWQFMFGFLAFYVQKLVQGTFPNSVVTNRTQKSAETAKLLEDEERQPGIELTYFLFLLPSALWFAISLQPTSHRQLNRVFVILLTTLTIGLSADSWVLTNSVLVAVGDISYLVYLVHWPIFEWHRYAFADFDTRYPTAAAGLSLISVSLILGQLIEESFKRVAKLLTSWSTLLIVISVLYAAIGGMLHVLKSSEMDYTIHPDRLPSNYTKTWEDAIRFHETYKDNPEPLSPIESLTYTRDFAEIVYGANWFCNSKIRKPPTNYANRYAMGSLYKKQCTVTDGQGTKTIVVFGNSFARNYMPGILHYFRDVYANVTLLSRAGCMFVGGTSNQRQYDHCKRERKSLIPMLRKWKYPIDIVVFGQAFNNAEPKQPFYNKTADSIFVEMQEFFDDLNEIAREVVLIPMFQYNNGLDAYVKILERKLALGQDLSIFKTPLEFVRNFHPETRHRLAAVECGKCAKLAMEDLWCRKKEGYCDAVDSHRRLGLFYDYHHPNLYGSLFIGEFLRVHYDQWTADHHSTTTPTESSINTVETSTPD